MKKKPNSIISKLIVFVVIAIVLPVVFYLTKSEEVKESVNMASFSASLLKLAKNIEERWEIGDIEGLYGSSKFQCSNIINDPERLDSNFLRCNMSYFNCFLAGDVDSVTPRWRVKKYSFMAVDKKLQRGQKGNYYFRVREKQSSKIISIMLKDSCRQVGLKKDVYSAGPKEEKSLVWDNKMYNISIDKNYVSNQKIYEWKEKEINKHNSYRPALNLSLKQQKKYCADIGMELLRSEVLDAMSFYPVVRRGDFHFKLPVPWTKSKRNFLATDEDLSYENCSHAKVLGCDKVFKKYYSSAGANWSKIFNLLGGELESVQNNFIEKANLKVSNDQLARSSLWHRIGLRAYWSGDESNTLSGATVKEEYTDKEIEYAARKKGVAFRCMRIEL